MTTGTQMSGDHATERGSTMLDVTQAEAEISTATDQPLEMCTLKVGETDERGSTVKYIYSCDRDYVVYYSRLEPRTPERMPGRLRSLCPFGRTSAKPVYDPAYESEGV